MELRIIRNWEFRMVARIPEFRMNQKFQGSLPGLADGVRPYSVGGNSRHERIGFRGPRGTWRQPCDTRCLCASSVRRWGDWRVTAALAPRWNCARHCGERDDQVRSVGFMIVLVAAVAVGCGRDDPSSAGPSRAPNPAQPTPTTISDLAAHRFAFAAVSRPIDVGRI